MLPGHKPLIDESLLVEVKISMITMYPFAQLILTESDMHEM
jgi:hypothetical protein